MKTVVIDGLCCVAIGDKWLYRSVSKVPTNLTGIMSLAAKRDPAALPLFPVNDIPYHIFAGTLDPINLDTGRIDVHFLRERRHRRNEVGLFEGDSRGERR